MKIVQINSTYGRGSTGKICKDISDLLTKNNIENYALYTLGESDAPNAIQCSNRAYTKIQALKSRVFGNYGFNSKRSTKKMIRELEKIRPDIIHLHNIHSHDCDLEMLFAYFRKVNQKIVWTFHDCWAFTGYCTYFDMVKCNKWQTGCKSCPQYRKHSFFLDRSNELYRKKKVLFSGLDMTIVTPSQWLADLVKQSFLQQYPVKVINNGIDLSVFKPNVGNFRETYGIGAEKYLLLGVAFDWGVRKGLDIFVELSKRLDSSKYQIVLVGTNNAIDKQIPKNIISIHRTQNQQELAEIYSTADLFVNPTREDNYPTVNMEAIACGTPVVTFNTGGSPEMIDENTGAVIKSEDIDALNKEIVYICEKKPYSRAACINKSKKFDRLKEYLVLYE